MENSNSSAISEEALDEYVKLTYLNKNEICQWVQEFDLE